jgi:predicted DNA-binding protein
MLRLTENDTWLSFRLPGEHRARLDEIASAQARTRSDLMREVIEILVSDSLQAPTTTQRVGRKSPRRKSVQTHSWLDY